MSRSQSAVVVLLIVAATSLAGARQLGVALRPDRPSVVPMATVAARVAAFATIVGNALDSTDGPMANVVVRLRDARFGRIVQTQSTDRSGIFAFKELEPGSYIVEIVANDRTILAASQLLNVDAGETASTVVKLPFKAPRFAGMMASTRSAVVLVLEAAATGIMALVPTAPISPNQ